MDRRAGGAVEVLTYNGQVALHNIRRSKVLSSLMVLAISIGIGASMTTLAVMRLLSADPLPGRSQHIFYPQVDVNPDSKGREPLDVMDYKTAFDLWSAKRASQQALVASYHAKLRAPESTLPPMMVSVTSTTADFFAMFAVPFQYGRAWSADDDAARARGIVISSELNRKIFGGANSVGRSLRIGDADLRIVGVLAPWRPSPLYYKVRGGRFSSGDTAYLYSKVDDVFMPFSSSLDVSKGSFEPFTCWGTIATPGDLVASPCAWLALWVRLDDQAAVDRYRAFLQGYADQQRLAGRIKFSDNVRLRNLVEWLDFNQVVPSDVKLQTLLAFAFLLICISNVVGLLLAKFMRYGAEIGLRRALGATRRDILMQCLSEAATIGALGGGGGLVLTLCGLALVRRQQVEYADLAHLDVTTLLITMGLSVAASLLAGVIPAVRASLTPTALQLKLI
ncbi:ABC transporter permease [Luteibacter aegosomaticola]|nr:ABC transporter permease [Luteibacter aegosomaticola]UPG92337.1 ABC transporter permease [Luteibacter aegosomaticola]